jgi:hypothetical protein
MQRKNIAMNRRSVNIESFVAMRQKNAQTKTVIEIFKIKRFAYKRDKEK